MRRDEAVSRWDWHHGNILAAILLALQVRQTPFQLQSEIGIIVLPIIGQNGLHIKSGGLQTTGRRTGDKFVNLADLSSRPGNGWRLVVVFRLFRRTHQIEIGVTRGGIAPKQQFALSTCVVTPTGLEPVFQP